MIRIMVMNGLLISLILIWTSAAKEPSAGYLIKSSTKPPTGPLNYSVSKPMVSLHETNKEILRRKFLCGSELGGVCVNKKKSCPSNLPSEKSPGKPYCSKKKDRCCYPDPTTAAPPTVVPTTTTTSEDVNWSDIRNACIKSNNYKTYQPLALDICKEKCVEEDAINCQSIEYSSAQQMCAISEARSDSDDFIEPCFVDGWVFAEIDLNAGPTTGAPTTLAPSNTTINGPTTGAPTTTAPGNTTINVSSCNLVWNYEEDRPLIMIRETKTIVPPIIDIEISEDPNRIPEGKKLIFACPGENNQFNHVQGTHTKLHGECISHEQFKVCVNNYPEILDLSQLSCSSKMQPSIIKQDNDTSYEKSCEDIGGELYKFGYIYGDYREFKDLDTKFCFREKDQTTLWTSTNIDRIEISPSMRSMDPANFRTARGLAMNTFYSQKSQQETLKEILDKEVTSVWNDKACRNHGGHCVRGGRPCPKHLPHHTSQGEPFCTSFYRCCYSDQCDPSACTYKGKKGNCSLDYLPGTTGVGSQECKKGCQCYIKDNKTLLQFKSFQERKELSKLLRGNVLCGGGGRDCDPKCQNGGTCNSNFECDCAPGWKGVSCEFKDCDPKCQNGGTCNSNLECDCAPGWKGKSCEIKDCKPKCQNGGTCNSNLQCDCAPGWKGKSCEIKGKHCDLKWPYTKLVSDFKGERPLILDDVGELIRPMKKGVVETANVPHGSKLIFSCSGVGNTFMNKKFPVGVIADVECNDGKLKSLSQVAVEKMKDMGCKKSIGATINKKQDQIPPLCTNGILYAIEFEIKGSSNYPSIEFCFEHTRETTLWTKNTIYGKNWSAKVSRKDPKSWTIPGSLFFTHKIDDVYTVGNQIKLFKRPEILERNIIDKDKNKYFGKGHLVPRSDFVTRAEQDATYNYVNCVPQWQKYNGGNWAQIEEQIQKLAEKLSTEIKVITGGTSEAILFDLKGKPKEIYLGWTAATPDIVPAPKYMWKLVYAEKVTGINGVGKYGVVIVTHNHRGNENADPPPAPPTGKEGPDPEYPCNKNPISVCDPTNNLIKWLTIKTTDRVLGITYCCEIGDLKPHLFPNVPKIGSVLGLI